MQKTLTIPHTQKNAKTNIKIHHTKSTWKYQLRLTKNNPKKEINNPIYNSIKKNKLNQGSKKIHQKLQNHAERN